MAHSDYGLKMLHLVHFLSQLIKARLGGNFFRASIFSSSLYFYKINFVLKLIETATPSGCLCIGNRDLQEKTFSRVLFFFFVVQEYNNKCLMDLGHEAGHCSPPWTCREGNMELLSLRDYLQ